jgi:hypothetical protein
MAITPLITGDTFQTWFNTTNSIISTVNGITVHNILPGDGISLTSSGNVFTIKHGSSVGTPVTFTGPVSFTNTVSFSSAPSVNTVTVSVGPVITGITAGNVVRITQNGLTLAQANTAENAEVLGIVVGTEATTHTVATSGIVNNSTFSKTIDNLLGVVGGTLSGGCAYFLRADTPGGITTIEPNTYGYVSKPVLLGITENSGAILPYRGIIIDGISAGITAELDNKLIIQIDYNSSVGPYAVKFENPKPGDPVLWYPRHIFPDIVEYVVYPYYSLGSLKVWGSLNGSGEGDCLIPHSSAAYETSRQENIIGIVTKVLADNAGVLTLEILTRGGSAVFKKSEMDSGFYDFSNPTIQSGWYKWDGVNFTFRWVTTNDAYDPNTPDQLQGFFQGAFCRIISNNDAEDTVIYTFTNSQVFQVNQDTGTVFGFVSGSSSSGITSTLEYDNLAPNGSFTIWQRGYSPFNGVTLGGLSGYGTAVCDRWFYITDSGNMTGLTLNLERQEFSADQIVVPGTPLYWVDVNQQYSTVTGLNYRPRFENIQRGAKLLQGQEATISFWAMAGVCGATMDLVYNRYPESYALINDISDAISGRVTVFSGIELGSSWNKYSYTFTTAQQASVDNTVEGWYGFGFEFPSSGITLSIAQVRLELGTDSTEPVYTLPQKELEHCRPYYLRTYDWDQTTGYAGTSRLNEHYVNLGNLLSQTIYDVIFPIEMVQTPTVVLYSPTGEPNEAYNVTKKADMRYPRCEGCPIHVNLPWDTTTVRTSLPSGNITVPNTTVNGMQIKINNGATHLDTLKFHYVADADIKFVVT